LYQSTFTDKTLTCADCGQEFVFTGREQEFFAERQFSEPRRCPACRAIRKASRSDAGGYGNGGSSSYGSGGGYGGYERGPREMHSATCANCGREALVPFRPTGSKPVYCSDCFSARR
jgi:CxxC-x17-CxxC domain-containing protein